MMEYVTGEESLASPLSRIGETFSNLLVAREGESSVKGSSERDSVLASNCRVIRGRMQVQGGSAVFC